MAPSRAGVVGQLRGSCLLVFGMLRFEMLVRFEHPIIRLISLFGNGMIKVVRLHPI